MANAATLKPAKPQIRPASDAVAPTYAPTWAFAMLSHRGRVRHTNQDACAALPERGIFIVCDGMGGVAGGEVASHLATEAFLNSLSRPIPHPSRRTPPKSASSLTPASPENGASPYPANHPHTRLHEAINTANHAVFQRAQKSRSLRGMGTTLVAALFADTEVQRNEKQTLWLAHVGDSRCYRFRRGALHLLTRDHSLVEEQIRAGVISRVQAGSSPIRNIITRAIGSQPAVEPDIAAHETQPGDLYLIASDGLTRELTDAEIASIIVRTAARAAGPAALESVCQSLIDEANAHGGHDNVTVLLIACP
jgi:serine/threonine protein phosphatase PrpC